MLGTCTRSLAASGLVDRNRPTANMETESAAPANGPASEMSTFVLRSGRIDLNCTNQVSSTTTSADNSLIFK